MSTARTAVLVSGGGTNLQALIDAKAAGKLPHVEFVSVIASRPDAYALKRAEAAGIPGHVAQRKGSTQEAFEQEISTDVISNVVKVFNKITGTKVFRWNSNNKPPDPESFHFVI